MSGPRWWSRLRTLAQRRRRLNDYDAEVSTHLEMLAADLEQSGLSAEDARREARRRFGAMDRTREEFRDTAGFPSLDELASDVRYGWRMIRRQPAFSALVVLLVAIGVGANTAIFSLVNAILLRPLPYPAADRLVVVRTGVPAMAQTYPSVPVATGEFLLMKSRVTAFESLGALTPLTQTLTGAGDATRVAVARVTASLLPMLGARPMAGRFFRDDEDREGRGAVALLTHAFWQDRFAGDKTVVGRAIDLDGVAYTVVGVLPADFRFPRREELGGLVPLGPRVDILRPAAFTADERENLAGDFDWAVIGRLRPGATLAQAFAQATAVTSDIARQIGGRVELAAQLVPLHEEVVRQSRRGILLLGWSVAAVLVVLVVNLANLLLAKVSARAHEASVRAALGAGRVRVARQLIIENLLLSALGGLAGLALAWFALRALATVAPASLTRIDEVQLDAPVLAFCVLVTLTAGVLFSALPAWRLAALAPQTTLRLSARTVSEGRPALRLQSVLVTAEVALSTTLLAASALLVASFVRLTHVDAGFSTERVVFAGVALSPTRYADDHARAALYERLLDGVRAVPGITTVTLASEAPLYGEAHVRNLAVEHETRRLDERPVINIRFVDEAYFQTLGITLKRGRLFDGRDRGRHVALLNERAAAAAWPGQDPIGRLFKQGNERHPFCEVIGIVADTREVSLYKAPYLMGYLPYWDDETPESAVLVLKTDLDTATAAPLVAKAVHQVDREIPVPRVQTFREAVDEAVAPDRFQMMLVSGFALVAMVLAALGVYGVPAFAVSRRTQEMGIRLALGAGPGSLVRLVMIQSLAPVASGIGLGLAGALVASRLLESLLFEASGVAWGPLALVSAGVAAVALVASYLPARRVIAIDPAIAIRGIGE